MSMVHVLVVATRPEDLVPATEKCLSCLKLKPSKVFLVGGPDGLPAKEALPCNLRVKAFQEAEEKISAFLNICDSVHDRFIGILALPKRVGLDFNWNRPDDIPPLSRPEGALILAFPEIQWIPVYDLQDTVSEEVEQGTMSLERAWSLCRGGYSPLFDGDGLRSCLIARLREGQRQKKNHVRPDVAVSLDEETSFSFMNAYAAYRFGYRAYPVTTLTAARELLADKSLLPLTPLFRKPCLKPSEFRQAALNPAVIVFEDVQLSFPDASDSGEVAEKVPAFGAPRDCDEKFSLLQQADFRVVATAARHDEKIAENESGESVTAGEYFRKRRNARRGAYRALQGMGLQERLRFGLGRSRERASRWWFNTSGAWAGHWLVKFLDAALMVGMLVGVLFWKVSVFLPILFGLFVLQGLLRCMLRTLSKWKGLMPEWARMYVIRLAQWRFLPKRYRNHYPENRMGKIRDTFWTVTHKPLSGIFGLRNECCLPNGRLFNGIDDTEQVQEQYRVAKGKTFGDSDAMPSIHDLSHAAPGMAMEIAVRLLRRAERLEAEDKIIDAEGAIYGAVLATVAGELLDAKTPAVSIEALTWKQYFEIRAECEFVGVRAHTDMVDRYIDIHNAMGRICRSSNGLVREDVFTSGMAELMDKLSSLLAEKGKKEESLFFEKKARMFHRRLMGPMGRNLLAYPEWLLRSAWHVVIGLVALLIVSCAFWMSRVPHEHPLTVYQAATQTYEMLFCDEPDFNCETLAGYSIILRTMRQIVMLHLAFLGLCFWDVMRKK